MSKARKSDIIEAIVAFYDLQKPTKPVEKDTYKAEPVATDNSKVPYINANLHSFLKADKTYQTMVSVSCGAASSNYPVVGKSVGFVKATYREILNIVTDSKGVVNGDSVNDSYILKSGDTLEFVRQAGSKG
jgi:hypothetical protein